MPACSLGDGDRALYGDENVRAGVPEESVEAYTSESVSETIPRRADKTPPASANTFPPNPSEKSE
jgi:hypothetical protein